MLSLAVVLACLALLLYAPAVLAVGAALALALRWPLAGLLALATWGAAHLATRKD